MFIRVIPDNALLGSQRASTVTLCLLVLQKSIPSLMRWSETTMGSLESSRKRLMIIEHGQKIKLAVS